MFIMLGSLELVCVFTTKCIMPTPWWRIVMQDNIWSHFKRILSCWLLCVYIAGRQLEGQSHIRIITELTTRLYKDNRLSLYSLLYVMVMSSYQGVILLLLLDRTETPSNQGKNTSRVKLFLSFNLSKIIVRHLIAFDHCYLLTYLYYLYITQISSITPEISLILYKCLIKFNGYWPPMQYTWFHFGCNIFIDKV